MKKPEERYYATKDTFDAEEWIHPYIRGSEKRYVSNSVYRFEKCFDLIKDQVLLRAGVEICAITEVQGSDVSNQISFRRGENESIMKCVHTTVTQFVLNPEVEDGIEFVSTEDRPELKSLLEPEEHYVAMKSFVGFLVENGIINSLVSSYRTDHEEGMDPLDSSVQLRGQIICALIEIAPDAFVGGCNWNVQDLKTIDGEVSVPLWTIRSCISQLDVLPEFAQRELSRDPDWTIRMELAARKNLAGDLVDALASDRIIMVREVVAARADLPEDLIRKLARDEDPEVRQAISQRTDLPADVMVELDRPWRLNNTFFRMRRD